MEIKSTMRYHLSPVAKAIFKKTSINKFWRWCKEKNPETLLGGTKGWCDIQQLDLWYGWQLRLVVYIQMSKIIMLYTDTYNITNYYFKEYDT